MTDHGERGHIEGFDAPRMYETATQEADRLVHGDRGANYGHPIDDFSRTGRMWAAILGLDEPVPPELVGLCMAAVKISREVNAPKRDNRVDLAGYAETVEMIHVERGRREGTSAKAVIDDYREGRITIDEAFAAVGLDPDAASKHVYDELKLSRP